jgi:hypothetical protein
MSDTTKTSREDLDRREFTAQAVLALLSGVVVTVVGCGGGSSSPSSPSPSPGDRVGSVTANHGHVAVITSAQLAASDAVTLNIRGSADHPHTVALTMGEVMQIAGGQRVSKISSTDDLHNHTVIFN